MLRANSNHLGGCKADAYFNADRAQNNCPRHFFYKMALFNLQGAFCVLNKTASSNEIKKAIFNVQGALHLKQKYWTIGVQR